MWCQKCQADVAGIASSDNERALCTTCGNEIARSVQSRSGLSDQPAQSGQPLAGQVESPRSLRDPRELLARWAREDALSPLEIVAAREIASDNRKSYHRIDLPHPIAAPRQATFENARVGSPVPPLTPVRELPPDSGRDNIVHQAHDPNPPHFQSAPVSMADRSSKWVTLVGQIFAYLGVAGVTVGTSLVLMGYFGGPASYATTGWLVATAGQMLLFLGVVTLVSGGMEQTTQEVARRIDTLGERLVRIEQATERAESKRAG